MVKGNDAVAILLESHEHMQAVRYASVRSRAFTVKRNGTYRHVLHICENVLMLYFGVVAETKSIIELTAYYQRV